jgi:isochorismate synthase
VRDIYLHIDRERARFAHETASLLGKSVLFSQQFTLLLEYDAVALHECMCHEPGPGSRGVASEFFWQDAGCAIVGMGSVGEIATVGSFAELHAQLGAWRAMCTDEGSWRQVRAVGGLSFDAQHVPAKSSMWRAYDRGKFWVPRCMMRVEPGKHWVLTLCVAISPELTLTQLEAHLQREANIAEAWISAARLHDVSHDASPVGLTSEEPARHAWGKQVQHASQHMMQSELDKVVLARRVEVGLDRRTRPAAVLHALTRLHPTCTTFLVRPEYDLVPGTPPPARFVGASPECLVRMDSGTFYVDALAGSAPVEAPDEQLLQSAKDRQEHQLVVQEIAESLKPFGQVDVGEIKVDTLRNIKHLRTPVSGSVSQDAGLTLLAGALHPTPAVCGKPRASALEYLRAHEYDTFLERGWYTGVVGWVGLDDRDGAFYVALRCALLGWKHATLFVGAGIMPDSDPDSEIVETRNKARAVLDALTSMGEVST